MTPAEAAAILGVAPDASEHELERAYRARARELHPDRLAGASADRLADASHRFALLGEAHDVLRREIPVVATIEPEGPPRSPRWLIIGWLAVLAVAGVISYFGGALPYSTGDVVLRLLPLAASATAFALTGQRVYYAVTVALLAASVLVTLALASFGSLIAFGLLVVPVVGLIVIGRGRDPRR